jgi:hypothetical protein
MKSLLTLITCIGLAVSGLSVATLAADPAGNAKALYDRQFNDHFPDAGPEKESFRYNPLMS